MITITITPTINPHDYDYDYNRNQPQPWYIFFALTLYFLCLVLECFANLVIACAKVLHQILERHLKQYLLVVNSCLDCSLERLTSELWRCVWVRVRVCVKSRVC